jgi:hypothetical protein
MAMIPPTPSLDDDYGFRMRASLFQGTRGASRGRLRLIAAALVTLIALGVGYDIIGTRPVYSESATVVFSLPKSDTSAHAYGKFFTSFIASGEAMSQTLMSPQIQREIRMAGGTASVDLELVNLFNEERPDYGIPLATLTTASPSMSAAHRTFMIAARRLSSLLAARQAAAGAYPRDRLSAQLVADTGAAAEKGSLKRALAGLGILALAAVAGLWKLIDAWL